MKPSRLEASNFTFLCEMLPSLRFKQICLKTQAFLTMYIFGALIEAIPVKVPSFLFCTYYKDRRKGLN